MAKKAHPSSPPGWKLPAPPGQEEAAEKPVSEMSDEELSEAIQEAKRELLKAQRAELRAREARPSPTGAEEDRRYFSELNRRPYWR